VTLNAADVWLMEQYGPSGGVAIPEGCRGEIFGGFAQQMHFERLSRANGGE
jgi:hypothetical protein